MADMNKRSLKKDTARVCGHNFYKMENVIEYFKEKLPHIHPENCKSVMNTYMDYIKDMQGRHYNFCTICLKKFSEEEFREAINNKKSMDYQNTCLQHRKYREYENVDQARSEAGITVENVPLLKF